METLNVLEEAKETGLYEPLVMQLNKDFKRAGLQDAFDLKSKPEALQRSLIASLYELIVSDFEGYLNLLYAIDVSEQRLKQLPDMQVHELAETVTELVFNREFKKVYFKNKHE